MSNASRFAWLTVVVSVAGLHAAGGPQEYQDRFRRHAPERFLYICAGDQARQAPDFVAVIDFNPASPGYGRVIDTVPFPASSASGNEPHHIGLSSDGRTLACGGLLSVLKGQREVFFFDVSHPTRPRFIRAAD